MSLVGRGARERPGRGQPPERVPELFGELRRHRMQAGQVTAALQHLSAEHAAAEFEQPHRRIRVIRPERTGGRVGFLRTRLAPDLAQAITEFTEVADTIPYGEPDHAAALGNLGRAWLSEHRFSGDTESLRQSVTALGSAVRASALDTPPARSLVAEFLTLEPGSGIAASQAGWLESRARVMKSLT